MRGAVHSGILLPNYRDIYKTPSLTQYALCASPRSVPVLILNVLILNLSGWQYSQMRSKSEVVGNPITTRM